jgi:arabinose operon protein AraL
MVYIGATEKREGARMPGTATSRDGMVRYQGYILDLDGTVYRGEHAIPGAAAAIAELRRCACRVILVTNHPTQRREAVAAKLNRLGIPASPDEVINASFALAHYLVRHMPDASVFAIGEPPLLEELAAANLHLSDRPDEIDVVVASLDRAFNYDKLAIAFRALRRGARFLATNADASYPVEGGELPHSGAIIGALEGCTGRRVEVVVGKPSAWTAEMALEQLGLPASACLVVGDRLETDIAMGRQAGIPTALVLTGVTRVEDLAQGVVVPDFVLHSLADLPGVSGLAGPGPEPAPAGVNESLTQC